MGYCLAIDHGNTAVKVALYEGDTLIDVVTAPRLDAELLHKLCQGKRIESAIYCTVARDREAETECLRLFTDKVVKMSNDLSLPLVIDYAHPETLGVDRIAAAVGARQLFPGRNLLVVDAGTAVTYDVVSEDGRFCGGNIAPGLKMRLDALHRYTAALPQLEVPDTIDTNSPFGHDTASAIIKGAVFGVLGAIEGYLKHLPADTRVVMTGGSSHLLSQALNRDVTVDEHLLTNGLICILHRQVDI